MIRLATTRGVRRFKLIPPPGDWKEQVLLAPLPILLVFHDERSSADAFSATPLGADLAALTFQITRDGLVLPAQKLVVVFLQGVALGRSLLVTYDDPARTTLHDEHASWNSGHRGLDARMLAADDVAFVDDLLSWLRDRFQQDFDRAPPPGAAPGLPPLDEQRIYAVGVGNGGMLLHRLACELPARPGGFHLAGFCALGATIGGSPSMTDFDNGVVWVNDPALWNPPKPLHVLLVHAAHDTNVDPLILPGDPDGVRSEGVRDRLVRELGDDAAPAAEATAPYDYGLPFTRDTWLDWAAPVALTLPTAPILRTGVSYDRTMHLAGGVTLTTLVQNDDPPPAYTSLHLARCVWDYLVDPTSILVA